jgi:hypothetical protein
MAKYTTPGVYIDELRFNLPDIDAVPAGIPAFIGHAVRATENAKAVTLLRPAYTAINRLHQLAGRQ